MEGTFLRRTASTAVKYEKSARPRLQQRRVGAMNGVLGDCPDKVPAKRVGTDSHVFIPRQ